MSYTRAEAAFQRATAAFRNPTLDLLHGRYAPFVVATLSLIFTPDRPSVAVSDAHVEIGDIVDEIAAAGRDSGTDRALPAGNGREIARYWVRVGWIVPQIENGNEVYRLSAQAVGALEIAGRAGTGRTLVSRSRVRTLLDSIDQLAQHSEADPEQRIARLREETAAIDAQIRDLEAGYVAPVDDDELLEEAEHVLHLSRELPADFARVAESINAMQRDVVAELRRDVRPTGEVLREYLHRGHHVMDATPEGRAFAGALNLIGDPEHIDQLTDQIDTLLAQQFARGLPKAQRGELSAIAKRVEQGVQEVLTAQRRASHVITAQVRTHDPARDREVDELLRGAMAGLHSWMQVSKPGDRVDPLRRLPQADIGHFRQSLNALQPEAGPAPLHAPEEHAEIETNDALEWGGPHYQELEAFLAGLGPAEFDLAEAFAAAGTATGRPADLLGMLEIAHRLGMAERDEVSTALTTRPDGTTRSFAFAAVTGNAAQPDSGSAAHTDHTSTSGRQCPSGSSTASPTESTTAE